MASETHTEQVLNAVGSASGASRLTASWRRSMVKHGLDPSHHKSPRRFEMSHVAQRREELGSFLEVATPKLDQLFQMVGSAGCCVLLTDRTGVVLEQRSKDTDAETFDRWGLWAGADWSEQSEGTNGIGTCIAETRHLTIHRDEHFFSRNTAMSCMDSPIFGPDGELIGALDVSSCRADQTETYARLIGNVVAQTAKQIETDAFRMAFPKARIITAPEERGGGAVLLAVDQDDLVIGATRAARRLYELGRGGVIVPRPASDILGRDTGVSALERAERAALKRAIARAGGNMSAAARELGIGRATLYRRMNRLGLGES
ncbi:GAF domain-containing protein [Pacificibacter marinus]|uniref:Acetoin catabolism regulatory protein n=1 Tax=Pacificibacter marinus TaxID=658057 RepID=A0A1Y5TN19_9RHOB|nr:GAF domain-containing protein [Pacificibacter marinus]SEL19419.1 GAF domain-containing protein [Pacificibacter marinus]SLN64026.1 Acetoin catabolism regulatory protein [Pacificibacter marinus]